MKASRSTVTFVRWSSLRYLRALPGEAPARVPSEAEGTMLPTNAKEEVVRLENEIRKLLAGKLGTVALEALGQVQASILERVVGREAAERVYIGVAEIIMEEISVLIPNGPMNEAPHCREDYALASLKLPNAKSAKAGKGQ